MRNLMCLVLAALSVQLAHAQIGAARVTGGEVSGTADVGITVFKGIPFAAPPVGALRWKAPAAVKPWSGVRRADAFAPACMQPLNSQGNTAPVSEDCLYLNVWTPAKSAGEKLPVIVWIHGGGYVGGSTSIGLYDGSGYARKGVVLVSLAYRLGPYGYLAHADLSRESGHGSGTYGILDLVAGLTWVQKNVAAFGGDPRNVTIFGHSAGSGAVSILAASPLGKGLFERVIAMSGAAFTPLQTTNDGASGMTVPTLTLAERNGAAFLSRLGVQSIAEARSLSAEAIQAGTGGGLAFRPVADGYVLPADPYTLFQQGRFNDTPVPLGHTSDETLVFGGPKSLTAAEFESQTRQQFGEQADAVLAVYPHATDAAALSASRHLRNDTQFGWNMWTWAREQSTLGRGKVFSYYYDHHAPQAEGSGHGSDVAFHFETLSTRGAPTKENLALSDVISSYDVNFAKSGDPNGPGLPQWPAFTERNELVMVYDATPGARPYPILDRVKVLDGYFDGLRKAR